MANIKELFPEFYQAKLDVADLSKNSKNIIVVDSNFLLDIIQQPTSVAKRYIEALEKVKDNLYVPYLVALEFNFQKSKRKKEKIKIIRDYKENIQNTIKSLGNQIQSNTLVDKSEQDAFSKEMIEKTEDFSKELLTIVDKNTKSFITKEEETIYNKLIDIIEDKVGDPYTQDWIDKIETEGIERYDKMIPPGFNDSGKDEDDEPIRSYGDITYQRKYGDLIIWKDIIKHSKDTGEIGKKVIFITNDGKNKKKTDLLYKVKNLTVGPHIHMMNELQSAAQKEFYIVENLRFVQLVIELTDDEVRDLESSSEDSVHSDHKIKYSPSRRKDYVDYSKYFSDREYKIDEPGETYRAYRVNKDKDDITRSDLLKLYRLLKSKDDLIYDRRDGGNYLDWILFKNYDSDTRQKLLMAYDNCLDQGEYHEASLIKKIIKEMDRLESKKNALHEEDDE